MKPSKFAVFGGILILFGALVLMGKRPAAPASRRDSSAEGRSRRGSVDPAPPAGGAVVTRATGDVPRFERYFSRARKALRTEKENLEMKEELSDSGRIEECADILRAEAESELGLERQQLRMEMVDFLVAALSWKENPARDLALRKAEEIAERDLSQRKAPAMLKRSLAGDQIELLRALVEQDPQVAAKVASASKGVNRILVAYALQGGLSEQGESR